MTTLQRRRLLTAALAELAPADGFDRILDALPYRLPTVTPTRRKVFRPARLAAVAVACLALIVVALGVVLYTHQQTVDTLIDIDINPSIELAVNRADRVQSAAAVNEDGKAVLGNLSLKNASLEDAVTAIMEEMVAQGYMGGDNNHILVTVQNTDEKRATQLRAELTTQIKGALARHQVKAAIANQTLTSFDEAARFAEEHGISKGKAAFILALTEKAPSLDAARLATYHFGALAVVAEQNGVDLQQLVDYDATDSAWSEIQLTLEQQVEQAEQKLGCYLHTLEEAKKIALRGFDEEFQASAVFVVTEFIWEGDIPAYHLEFISQQSAVYCYVINAIDGSDLPTEYEKEQASTTPPETVVSGGGTVTSSRPVGSTTTAWIDQFIGEEPAESIAFAERQAAGADVTKAQQVTTTLCHRWGNAYYKVSFLLDNVQYTYEIDAISGEILKLDKQPQTTTTTTQSADPTADGHINNNEAKTIAYKYIGIQPSQAQFISLERQYLDGTATLIDFRFTHNDRLYVFYIHSISGEVMKHIVAPADLREEDYAITERRAEAIALADAVGLTSAECTELSIVITQNADGIPIFQVYFTCDGVFYGYEISGVDGTILSKESHAVR